MNFQLTAQDVFNGDGFDAVHMLRKAQRELDRLRGATDPEVAYDHMFNFAVTMAAVSDWTFHLELSQLPHWAGKKEPHFTNWVRYTNSDAFVFIDLSNEYKHASRNKGSFLAQKALLKFVFLKQQPAIHFDPGVMLNIGTSDGGMILMPWIERSDGNSGYFIEMAKRAIAWWKTFDPAMAVPLNSTGGPA